jgi:cell division protein FtsB
MTQHPLNARGRREVRAQLRDAAARTERRADELRARISALEAEIADLDKMRAAIEVSVSIIDADTERVDA